MWYVFCGHVLWGWLFGVRWRWGVACAAAHQRLGAVALLGPLKALRELMGCTQSRELNAHAPRLPRFILQGSFCDALLVISILDVIYDCHL